MSAPSPTTVAATQSPRDWQALTQRLHKAVSRVCPSWLVDAKDDLVQAALIKVMNLDRQNEGKRDLSSSYLSKVAYSALVDEIRRHRRRKESDLDDEIQGDRWEADTPTPERAATGGELGRAIEGCLRGLIEDRRLAVALHLRGHGVPEAANILGWARKRTENLVYRGLFDLRSCLDSAGFAP